MVKRPNQQVVKEHYLRDDVYCGCSLAQEEYRGEYSFFKKFL